MEARHKGGGYESFGFRCIAMNSETEKPPRTKAFLSTGVSMGSGTVSTGTRNFWFAVSKDITAREKQEVGTVCAVEEDVFQARIGNQCGFVQDGELGTFRKIHEAPIG